MKEELNSTLRLGALLAAFGVVAGAFGAHALRGALEPYYFEIFEKAVLYHLVHAVGILSICSLGSSGVLEIKTTKMISYLMAFGIIIFSGSLYILSVTGIRWLGAVTPLGGTAFIVSWILLFWAFRKRH